MTKAMPLLEDRERRQIMERALYNLEARFMDPARNVNWMAMRDAMEEEEWRVYINLRREFRRA